MVGLKMCSLKCAARGYCWSIGYDVVSLMCHVLKLKLDHREECGHITFIPKPNTSVSGFDVLSCQRKEVSITTSIMPSITFVFRFKLAPVHLRHVNIGDAWKPVLEEMYVSKAGKITNQRYQIHLNTKLVHACVDGNINRVKCILFDGRAEINVRGPQRKTPVMIAAEKAHIDMFGFLVRKGADLSVVDAESNTVLHLACEGGNLDIIETVLVQDTVDINSLGGQDRTPAMKAALKGHKHVFDLLVRKGADLSHVDFLHNTILHLACEGGNLDIVKHILTQNTVNINSLGENDWTPAMKAAIKGHKDVFDLIVKEGADLSLVDKEGDSILHAACEGGNVEIVTYMLKQSSVDINLRGNTCSRQ
ncbi:putative ankyrin repeat protein RF_0381 [Haliotis rubra]|uniref:putative ankyrin repeat protein RF_0381 n=1 Tax=Haliotis rubra TaxID=36100 RepID=UPI001EE5E786|nr:putative ankyrin repeat protein RF_0381 [Haliotis rubra]